MAATHASVHDIEHLYYTLVVVDELIEMPWASSGVLVVELIRTADSELSASYQPCLARWKLTRLRSKVRPRLSCHTKPTDACSSFLPSIYSSPTISVGACARYLRFQFYSVESLVISYSCPPSSMLVSASSIRPLDESQAKLR